MDEVSVRASCPEEATRMVSRAGRAEALGLAVVTFLAAAGGSVFAVLAGLGGVAHLPYIILGVACASVLVSVAAVNRFIAGRLIGARPVALGRAIHDRARAAVGVEAAEWQAAEAWAGEEARIVRALRSRLSPVLYCLGKIAAGPSGIAEGPLIGSLTQAIVSAAIEHRNPEETRRSVFYVVKGDRMECANYAGYEGQQDSGRATFRNNPDDPVGEYMFRLLGEGGAVLIRDVSVADLPVRFPSRRSYQAIIAVAVMAGESMYGILTLDSPQADSLGQPELEIMKTLASLLGVGLALGGYGNKQRIQIPVQEIANHPRLIPILGPVTEDLWPQINQREPVPPPRPARRVATQGQRRGRTGLGNALAAWCRRHGRVRGREPAPEA
jgi:hypothetical protein